MTTAEVLQLAWQLAGKPLSTATGARFSVRVEGNSPSFTPASTRVPRSDGPAALARFVARYNETGSLRPVDYQDVTRNSSYYEHLGLPRTLFDNPTAKHFYDQIAWFTGASGAPNLKPPLRYENLGGNFDFRPALQGTLSNVELSWRISDHFPLWASFSVRPT